MRRSIWILLALLAALLALTLFLENREVEQPIIGTETSRLIPNFLFSAKNGLVTSLKIENVEEYGISLQRGTDGLWDVLEPEGVEIEQGVAEAAVSQVLALPLLAEELSISPLDVGIGKQAPLVEVGFADDAVSVFRVGNLTSSGSGYYIQYEKEKIGIVGRDGLDSLFKLLLLFE